MIAPDTIDPSFGFLYMPEREGLYSFRGDQYSCLQVAAKGLSVGIDGFARLMQLLSLMGINDDCRIMPVMYIHVESRKQ